MIDRVKSIREMNAVLEGGTVCAADELDSVLLLG